MRHTPGPWVLIYSGTSLDLKGNNRNTLIAEFPTLASEEGPASRAKRKNKMTANEILSDLDLRKGTCTASYIQLAYRLANDEGTIQAGDMLQLSSDPTEHTTSNLRSVLLQAGCEDVSGREDVNE